jgi:subtilase family serine protease
MKSAGFQILGSWSQGLTVEGTVGQAEALLQTGMQVLLGSHGNTRVVATGERRLPESLKSLGARIVAFANLPPRHVDSVVRMRHVNAFNRDGSGLFFYWFDDLKQAYGYPAFNASVPTANGNKPLTGSGVGIGILMSSIAQQSDLDAYFNAERFTAAQSGTAVPIPKLEIIEVDGGSGAFGDDAADEASLDTQQSLGSAPGASERLYDIPDLSDPSILDGYKRIITDNGVAVVSSSFGGCEILYEPQYNAGVDMTYILQQYHQLFRQGNAQGITFVASSGDEAATPCAPVKNYVNAESGNFIPGVESPADDPHVTGVGGTNLATTTVYSSTPTLDALYDFELAYGDPAIPFDYYGVGAVLANGMWGSGGGVGVIFAKPAYQDLVPTASLSFRSVPDISMHMGGCPGFAASCNEGDSAVYTYIGGSLNLLIGTSASSPEFAGVVALLDQKIGGRYGNLNKHIYTLAARQQAAGGIDAPAAENYFHRLIPGANNGYTHLKGTYSEVLGVGTPKVAAFLGLPQGTPLAGTPQTPSNP